MYRRPFTAQHQNQQPPQAQHTVTPFPSGCYTNTRYGFQSGILGHTVENGRALKHKRQYVCNTMTNEANHANKHFAFQAYLVHIVLVCHCNVQLLTCSFQWWIIMKWLCMLNKSFCVHSYFLSVSCILIEQNQKIYEVTVCMLWIKLCWWCKAFFQCPNTEDIRKIIPSQSLWVLKKGFLFLHKTLNITRGRVVFSQSNLAFKFQKWKHPI